MTASGDPLLEAEAPAPAGTTAALEVEQLELAFGGTRALQGVSLAVRPAQVLALIGPNGAGKTSVINCVCGSYRPRGGRIDYEGRSLLRLKPHEVVRRGVARTFQNVATFHGLTVMEVVKLGASAFTPYGAVPALLGLPRVARYERGLEARILDEILQPLELADLHARPVETLSYGRQKAVDLARALTTRPRMLLLDEPAAGLTLDEAHLLFEQILRTQQRWGFGILLVEHHMQLVMNVSQQVVVMSFGQVIARGRPDQVQRDPEVIRVYLGAP